MIAVGAQVQLLGQPISVGRPSGYVDPSAAQAAALKAAEALERYRAPPDACRTFSCRSQLTVRRGALFTLSMVRILLAESSH